MQHMSSWAAVAPHEISKGKFLAAKKLGVYQLDFIASESSVWVVSERKNGFKIGFRVIFGFGSTLESVKVVKDTDESITFETKSGLGIFRATVGFIEVQNAIFRYTVTFTPSRKVFIPFSPHDVVVLSQNKGQIHITQEGTRSGHLFFSSQGSAVGSVFYFQNLSALSEYCDVTQTSVGGSVGGQWPEMGFRLPSSEQNPLSANTPVIVSDAFVLLSDETFAEPADIATAYLDFLAETYLLLPKPDTKYNDWPKLASLGLADLKNNKGCWTQAEGNSYLNAYVCDYDTPPEIMVQLAVLVPLTEYFQWLGQTDAIADEIHKGLDSFYDEKLKTISRWLPSLRHRLDQSEEQKKEDVMDSWYLHHPLMNLSRLALWKDKSAKDLLLKSVDYAIKVAQHFKYEWPVFYETDTLEVIKQDKGEKDVPGAYANLMLLMHDLTGDKKYFKEALKASDKLLDSGLDLFYQANNTSFSAATMLRLYKETGEQKFLDLTYICLCALFRNMQIWDGKYGYAKDYSRFFAVYPLSDAPYIAPYEELEVYAAFHYLLKEAEDIDLRPSARLLIAEFIKYFVFRMPFYYPRFLPKEVLSEEVKTGEIDPKLWIPLEDLRDGWEKSGQVGQEVYGAAGAGFGIIPRQYFRLEDDLLLFLDYPVSQMRKYKDSSVTLTVIGDARLMCRLLLESKGISLRKIVVHERNEKKEIKPVSKTANRIEYGLNGNCKIRISWQ